MNLAAQGAPVDRRQTLGLFLGAAFAICLFAPTLRQLAQIWLVDNNYSHGFFILPVSLWLAWLVVKAHPLPERGEPVQGLFTLGVGLVFQLIGVVLRYLPIELLALLLVLRGIAVLLGGQRWANRLLFPTLFLVFLFPVPAALSGRIAVALQDIIATLSTEVLGWFYLCFRRGNNIHIFDVAQPLFVAQECSGVRQIMAFLALAALVAYLGSVGFWRGVLLIALAVPIAIATNVIRVLLMAIGFIYFGPGWATTKMHDFPAMVTLPLGIAMFFGVLWFLMPAASERTIDAEPAATPGPPNAMASLKRIWSMTAFLGVALAIQAALLLHMVFGPSNLYPGLSHPLADLPMKLTFERPGLPPFAWEMQTISAENEIRPRLPFQPLDLIFRQATCNERSLGAECYIVHTENGEDRKHHPEICIRDVQQVPEDETGRATIELGKDPERTVKRYCFKNSPSRSMAVYYWHYTVLPVRQEQQSWLQMLHQTFDRSPPSVTVLVTTAAAREQWPFVEQTLLSALDQELRARILPANVKMSCERLPIGVLGK